MKFIVFVLMSFVAHSAWASSDLSAKQWLDNMATAVKQRNFVASFVVVKDRRMEPYRWSHARTDESEVELLTLLNGAGLEMVRVNDRVTYFEAQQQPYSIQTNTISGPIPEALFGNIDQLQANYNFVLGNKERIADRPAQLIKITPKATGKYSYWIWLDAETSLLLKSAYVNTKNEALEQLQLSHLSVTEQPVAELLELRNREFPAPLPQVEVTKNEGNWHVGWLPKGFDLIKSDRHKLSLNDELADYYLYSDGLVDVSIFVQRPIASQRPSGSLTSGASTIYIFNAGAFDVSVIGNIPAETAKSIAESVQRPL